MNIAETEETHGKWYRMDENPCRQKRLYCGRIDGGPASMP
ncbi:hypothetical protein A2U01_0061000, partial [Trifolium medium]|nr:hypothetical protein [Trifolium medium]